MRRGAITIAALAMCTAAHAQVTTPMPDLTCLFGNNTPDETMYSFKDVPGGWEVVAYGRNSQRAPLTEQVTWKQVKVNEQLFALVAPGEGLRSVMVDISKPIREAKLPGVIGMNATFVPKRGETPVKGLCWQDFGKAKPSSEVTPPVIRGVGKERSA